MCELPTETTSATLIVNQVLHRSGLEHVDPFSLSLQIQDCPRGGGGGGGGETCPNFKKKQHFIQVVVTFLLPMLLLDSLTTLKYVPPRFLYSAPKKYVFCSHD